MTQRKRTFHRKALYQPRRTVRTAELGWYLREQASFWVAILTVFAFIAGNMIGQHGWYAFWRAALGSEVTITYDGAIPPIAKVPDYERWGTYGGSIEGNTFRQVPTDLLIPLPPYDPATLGKSETPTPADRVYSVGYMGGYDSGADGDGSHPGVDIRTPVGTPILAVMNGIVEEVDEEPSGFGLYIVLKHPDVPSPANPSQRTTLYSAYAHLSQQDVEVGQIVRKGDQIGLSGQSGFATGPHLHFQIDLSTAPWHPFWPFSSREASDAGLNFTEAVNAGLGSEAGFRNTISPLAYLQSAGDGTLVAQQPRSSQSRSSARRIDVATARTNRLQQRLSRRQGERLIVARLGASATTVRASSSRASLASTASSQASTIKSSSVSSTSSSSSTVATTGTRVASVRFWHAGSFNGREWVDLTIELLDANGVRIEGTPALDSPLHLLADYGQVEFERNDLTAADFTRGEAVVRILPRGERTVVIRASAFVDLSSPLKHL
jgi:murein DD-endopeptidase MepM/ murein hydrolase activator NlpD